MLDQRCRIFSRIFGYSTADGCLDGIRQEFLSLDEQTQSLESDHRVFECNIRQNYEKFGDSDASRNIYLAHASTEKLADTGKQFVGKSTAVRLAKCSLLINSDHREGKRRSVAPCPVYLVVQKEYRMIPAEYTGQWVMDRELFRCVFRLSGEYQQDTIHPSPFGKYRQGIYSDRDARFSGPYQDQHTVENRSGCLYNLS